VPTRDRLSACDSLPSPSFHPFLLLVRSIIRVCLFSDAAFESGPEKTLTGMILKPADMEVNKILFVRTLGIKSKK
jgi:hypothetical protein